MSAAVTPAIKIARQSIEQALAAAVTDALRAKLPYQVVVRGLQSEIALFAYTEPLAPVVASVLGVDRDTLRKWKKYRECELFRAAATALVKERAPWAQVLPALQHLLAKGALARNNNNHGAAGRDLAVHRNSVWNWEKV